MPNGVSNLKAQILTLAINTSSSIESVALLKAPPWRGLGEKLLGEKIWKGQRDESEKLLPFILGLLKDNRASFENIGKIVVVRGPGPFSALRIGVTVANVLAHCLGAQLFSVDTPGLWLARIPGDKTGSVPSEPILLLHAGGDFVSIWGCGFEGQSHKIDAALKMIAAKFRKKPLVFFGDISENEMREFLANKRKNWKFIPEDKLKTFGETLTRFRKFKKEKTVVPKYSKPPNITKPRKDVTSNA